MSMDAWPRVAVVGAGAVGCYFGGLLARSGVPVTLIGRAPLMEAISRDGLFIDGLRIRERVRLRATPNLEEGLRGARVILLSVKTVHTETAAREMQPFLARDAAILSFQNGVDNVDRIRSATGLCAIPVAVYVGCEVIAPAHLKHNGRGDLVIGHRAGWPQTHDLAPLARMFEQAGVPCRVTGDIASELWAKITLNCAYNAISALTRARYGRMEEFEPVRELMKRLVAETVAVARAEGASITEGGMVDAAMALGRNMSGALSSTYQDIARGKPTEIDSLNGYVGRRASALGIDAPLSQALYAMVKLFEESSGPAAAD